VQRKCLGMTIAFAALVALCGCAASAKPASGYLEIRLAADEETPDYLQARVPELRAPIYVSPKVELTEADIKKAEVLEARGRNARIGDKRRMFRVKGRDLGPAVGIVFNRSGSRKLARLTEENVGKRLAIVIGGRVVSAPRIAGKIKKKMLLYGNFTREDAVTLVTILNGQYKPL